MSNVLLIGASNNPSRYSNKAMARLLASGHRVIPVHPFSEIEAPEPTVHHLSLVKGKIDIAVVYVRAELLKADLVELIRIAPALVIFSPGAESVELKNKLENTGIRTKNACTLVLLSIGRFDLEEE